MSQMSISRARWMQSTHSPSHFNIVFPSTTRTSKMYLTFTYANDMRPVVTTWCSYVLVRESNAKLLTNRNGGGLGVTWRCPLASISYPGEEWMELYLFSPITHYAVHTDQFIFQQIFKNIQRVLRFFVSYKTRVCRACHRRPLHLKLRNMWTGKMTLCVMADNEVTNIWRI